LSIEKPRDGGRGFRSADWGLRSGGRGPGTGDWGLRNAD